MGTVIYGSPSIRTQLAPTLMKALTPNLLIGLILCFGVLMASIFSYIFLSISEQEIEAFISELLPSGIQGIIYLAVIISLSTSIGLPRQVAAFASGFVLGALWGTLVSLIGVTIGCIITYGLAHKLSRTLKAKQSSALIQNIHTFFSKDTFYKALMIRVLPVGSNFITNILAGLSRAPRATYVSGSALGFIPQLYIFSLAGSGVRLKEADSLFISVALFLFALLVGTWLYKRSSINFNWTKN